MTITPDTSAAIAFLQRWPVAFPHLTAVHINPETGVKELVEARAFSTPVEWDSVRAWIEARQGKANLYFSVNSLKSPLNKKAGKADIAEVVALHIDIDVPSGEEQEAVSASLLTRVQAYDPPPSAVISSGGGAQAFWILEPTSRIGIFGDIAAAEAAECYTRGLEDAFSAERGAKADRCHNVDRIMRLPGTINIPDDKKRAKGRVARLAELVAFTDNIYPLTAFKPAPSKDLVPAGAGGTAGAAGISGGGDESKRVKVNLSWEGARNLWRTIGIEDMRKRGVAEHALMSLQHGDNLLKLHEHHSTIGHRVAEGPYDSYSLITLAIATALLRADLSPEECAAVMCDPMFPGNKHVVAKANDKEKHRAVERALQRAAKDIEASDKRAKQTAAGVPVWRDTYDESGCYPIPTLANSVIAIKHMGIECRQDLFHQKIVVQYGGEVQEICNLVGELSDDTLGAIRSMANNKFKYDGLDKNTYDAVREIARDHAFNPVTNYLTECQGKWDGKPRIDTWATIYMGVEDTALNRAIGAKMLLAACRRARDPGCKYDAIVVLEGPEGGKKSMVIETLAGLENFSDQTILGVTDKEAQELLAGVWIFECADLSGIGRAEIEHMKAFASRRIDRARKAYGRVVEAQPRMCILVGTTNDSTYLMSQTGNRRFQPLKVGVIDIEALIRDRDQLWAEAAHREAAGESIILPEDLWEAARVAQEQRRVSDPWEAELANIPASIFSEGFEGTNEIRVLHNQGDQQRAASNTLLKHVLRIPAAHQTSAHGRRLSTVMGRCGWQRNENGVVFINGKNECGYWRPLPGTPEALQSPSNDGPAPAKQAEIPF